MKRLAIIPARGGSKRLKNKNILNLDGKPLICYTIEESIKSKLFDKIIISTDDDKIVRIAKSYDIEISIRDKKLATDDAKVVDVCIQEIKNQKKKNLHFEILTCLYATSPMRNYKDIQEVTNMIEPHKVNFAVAMSKYNFPPHEAMKVNSKQYVEPLFPEFINLKSNVFGEILVDNGSTYSTFISSFLKEKTFFGKLTKAYIMEKSRSVDIDEIEDFNIVKKLVGLRE